MTIISIMLLIGVFSGCATTRSTVTAPSLGSYMKRPSDKFHCPVHNLYYGDRERGLHGGSRCKRRAVSPIVVDSSNFYGSASETRSSVVEYTPSCDSCGKSSCNGGCGKTTFSLGNANVQVNINRGQYWPSRRRMIYFQNVYSGRRIRYLGGDWGWGDSRRRRSRRYDRESNFNVGYWGTTGYRGFGN